MWHTEDEVRATHFARRDGNLYFLNGKGEIWITGNIAALQEGEWEGDVEWMADFADFTGGSPNKKGVGKIQVRLELDAGASAELWIQFDTDGRWTRAGRALAKGVKRSYILPVIPRRGDHYRLRIKGVGGCRVYSLVREFYPGSGLKSKAGRQ
jgi:hypothetical protein